LINHTNFKHKILVSCMSYPMYKIGQASKLSANFFSPPTTGSPEILG
jgi:hypothetical protein